MCSFPAKVGLNKHSHVGGWQHKPTGRNCHMPLINMTKNVLFPVHMRPQSTQSNEIKNRDITLREVRSMKFTDGVSLRTSYHLPTRHSSRFC